MKGANQYYLINYIIYYLYLQSRMDMKIRMKDYFRTNLIMTYMNVKVKMIEIYAMIGQEKAIIINIAIIYIIVIITIMVIHIRYSNNINYLINYQLNYYLHNFYYFHLKFVPIIVWSINHYRS